MYAENGSGGVMSDITFTGGNFGICECQFLTHVHVTRLIAKH